MARNDLRGVRAALRLYDLVEVLGKVTGLKAHRLNSLGVLVIVADLVDICVLTPEGHVTMTLCHGQKAKGCVY